MSKEITRVICEVGKEPIYVKEILTDEQVAEMEKQQAISQAQNRIQEIKMQLQGMDYMTSKIIDGDYDDIKIKEIKETRNMLRKEINDLENSLIVLGIE